MTCSPTSTPTEVGLRERNLLFLATPGLWPDRPFLPLVRRKPEGLELGVLFDCSVAEGREGFSTTVFLCNLFYLPPTAAEFFELPKEEFASPEEIFAAGWRVD
jgi:hypothetical protein